MNSVLTFITGGLGGSILTIIYHKLQNRMQKMSCWYTHSDELPPIPLHDKEESESEHLYYKTFVVKNTTNRDYSQIKLNFEFDTQMDIQGCSNNSISISNKAPIDISGNIATVAINDFNRNDDIMYTFILKAERDGEPHKVTVSGVTGVKVKYEDKRHDISKKSKSNALVINK